MDTSAPALPQGRRVRRQYSTEFRAQVIEAASQPGVSVAAIALANGMNANLLRRWLSMARGREMMMGAVTGTSPTVPDVYVSHTKKKLLIVWCGTTGAASYCHDGNDDCF